ncbi:MAG: hypothetical protein DRR08_31135 [Candidatus Parabeggiatoa sp. nov. 2]|nr:MAG: hypothetical protein B6247_26550 [Beggiatoa sp. 4572_84]RKZ49226.1 MAG: hypothetical protein DRR08_31135 [Gammaproteobacteria bacterium]
MKYPFIFEPEKSIEAILYIAQNVKQPTFHRISKIMYFADKARLEKYGRSICGDSYIAMKHGPVPSCTYDILKSVRGDGLSSVVQQAKRSLTVETGSVVKPLREANLDELSLSDLTCLDKAIKEYGALSFEELTQLSHDNAWESADENEFIELEQIVLTLANPELVLDHLKDPFPG